MGNTSFHKITEVKQLGRTWMGAHSRVEMDAVQYIVKNTVKPWSGETGPLIRACSSGKNVFLKIKIQKKHLNALTFTSALRRRVNFRAVPQQGSGCRRPQNRSSGGVRGGGPGHTHTSHVYRSRTYIHRGRGFSHKF